LGYKAFTDRITVVGSRQPTGAHLLDQLCSRHDIDHRLIPIRRLPTNGMVERFNGRIAEVLATTRFKSAEDLFQTLNRYVYFYNHHIPQQSLGHQAPVQAFKEWQVRQPELLNRNVINHSGSDT